MKKNLIILLLAVMVWVTAFALPVSAATTSDGFVYDGDNSMLWITDYTGSGGDITIPSEINGIHVAGIDNYAFADCSNITGVTIPFSTLFIQDYAFSNCTGMTSLTIGENVDYIGENAFENCTHLTSIICNARNSGSSSDGGPFSNAGTAGAGIHVTFSDSVEFIDGPLFTPEGSKPSPKVVSVTLGENIKYIRNSAFKNCDITSITIPDSVKRISTAAFYGCPLTSVTLGKGLDTISVQAFCNTSLTSVTIPKNVTTLGTQVFGFDEVNGNIQKTDLTIYGYRYSAAQSYAETNNFKFVCVGGQFSDVTAGAWYETYIDDLVAQGIFNGYSNDDENGTYSFQPVINITRAEFAAVLARASGEDLTPYAGNTSFSDVDVTGWAAKSIAWAYQHGIVYGTGHGKYSPAADITREDMAVMIARFANYQKTTLTPTQAAVVFADQSSISAYAVDAVTALQKAGIINGSVSQGMIYFNAKSNATRAEAAVMVSKLLDL